MNSFVNGAYYLLWVIFLVVLGVSSPVFIPMVIIAVLVMIVKAAGSDNSAGRTSSTGVKCPHCGELLTVPVNDPMGEESYQCCECNGVFDADWGEGTISHYPQAD